MQEIEEIIKEELEEVKQLIESSNEEDRLWYHIGRREELHRLLNILGSLKEDY